MAEIVSVQDLRNVQYVNLLLLGATGAGKSTFINALANYLTYESLEEAMESPLVNLIPFQLKVFNDQHQRRSFQVGTVDKDENQETGKSATLAPKTYLYRAAGMHLRCIDTAGIGDVRGRDQDVENFKSTMHHLRYLDRIDGICIFVNQNCSRLTEYFTFCVKQLFKHLDQDAAKNVVFMFPNSRANDYGPNGSDSFDTLQTFLKEQGACRGVAMNRDTTYFVDSEVVLLLAKKLHNVPIRQKEKNNCDESWKKSTEEIARLMSHLSSLKPHRIENTVFLNEVKTLVIALVDPMIKIVENTDKNIDLLNKTKKEVEVDATGATRSVPRIVLTSNRVPPRMVCTSEGCVKTKTINGASIIKYEKVCHKDCYIPGLKLLNRITPLNRYCEIMKGGSCANCNCSWEMHKNITWVYEEEVVQDEVNEDQDSAIDPEASKSACISQLEKDIDQHRADYEIIVDVAVQLGMFLDQNAILGASNQLGMFLDQNAILGASNQLGMFLDQNAILGASNQFKEQINGCIAQEAKAGRAENLKRLQSLLTTYEERKKPLESLQMRVSAIKAKDLIKSLYGLSSNGQMIEKCVACVQSDQPKTHSPKETVVDCKNGFITRQMV